MINEEPNMEVKDTHMGITNADPFAYLNRNDFTSEKFKIEIRGLPKYYGIREFKNLLNNKLNLKCSKLKPPKLKSEWIYVCFRSEEDRQAAIKAINGFKWKNRILRAEESSAVPDPLIKKRNQMMTDLDDEIEMTKKIKLNSEGATQQLKLNIVPFCDIPYNKQLEMKADFVKDVLKILGKELCNVNKLNYKLNVWLEHQLDAYNGLPCEVQDVKSHSVITGYRNKCEFTIGKNQEGKSTIGFRFGAYVDGTTNVGPVTDMPHVPEQMKTIVKIFESFIQNSELSVFHPEDHSGYWRQIMIRIGTVTNQLMVVIGLHPQNLTDDELSDLKGKVTQFVREEVIKVCDVTSLYIQFIAKKNFGCKSYEHLYGSETISEELSGLKFIISPESFFQINTHTTEILYNCIKEIASLNPNTVLLDVCCGTGSIGIYLSKYCKRVVGIECEEKAVLNAKNNCMNNNIDNCTFYKGKAEDIIGSVISDIGNDDIVAVVDPPRAGLHQRTIIQLRKATNLKKLIYLSCNPKAALQNFVSLGKPRSKTLDGEPFLPLQAIPVDMFPHTKHCELILYFQRFVENQFCVPKNVHGTLETEIKAKEGEA